MKNLALTICLVICCSSILGQKFGKFDYDLITQKTHADTSADAFYALHNGTVTFDIFERGAEFIIKVHDRIKILSDDGKEYADYSIPYYVSKGGVAEKVIQIKASTFNDNLGRVTETKVEKKNIFEERTSDNFRQKKFSFPNVKKGSVVEVSYLIRSPFVHQMPRWFFQKEIPVDKSNYQVVFNKYFRYIAIPKGLRCYDEEMVDYSNELQDKEFTYNAEGVPAFRKDDFILNKRDYMASIGFELHSVNIPGYAYKGYTSSWKDIGDNLMEHDKFGGQLKYRLKEFDFLIQEVSDKSDKEKIAYVFDYVRENFSAELNYSVYTSTGLNKIYDSRQGNVADVNLLLVSLLRKVNINAQPVVSKTRHSGLFNSAVPTKAELNYVMALVRIENNSFLLDATKKTVPMNQLPVRAVNFGGLEVLRSNSSVIELQNPNLSKYSINTDYVFDSEKNELIGKGLATYKGYAAVRYRDKYGMGSDSESSDDDEIESSNTSLNEINYNEITGVKNVNEPIKVRFDEILREEIIQLDNEYLIDATLDFGYEENPFYEDERAYPVFYSYLKDETHIISIELEEGITLKSKPESTVVKMPNNEASFMYDVKTVGNKLMIYHIFKINHDFVLPDSYPDLKAFYDLVVKKSKEKIVLVKN